MYKNSSNNNNNIPTMLLTKLLLIFIVKTRGKNNNITYDGWEREEKHMKHNIIITHISSGVDIHTYMQNLYKPKYILGWGLVFPSKIKH